MWFRAFIDEDLEQLPSMLKAKEYGAKLALQGLPEDVVRAKLDEYLENVRKFERDFGDDDDI